MWPDVVTIAIPIEVTSYKIGQIGGQTSASKQSPSITYNRSIAICLSMRHIHLCEPLN